MEATDVFDVSREPQHVLDAYGKGVNARQLLIARRLVERGVRYVQVWHEMDNHGTITTISKSIIVDSPENVTRELALY